MRQFAIIFMFSFSLLLTSCENVPFTGRSHTTLINEGQITQYGADSYNTILKNSKLSQNKAQVVELQKVGLRIKQSVESFSDQYGLKDELKLYKWEFNLIDDDKTINAFCLPGGKVAVYTGIMKVAANENGLAVIVGHEVAHAIAKHGNERMSQQMLLQLGSDLLGEVVKNNPEQTRNIFNLAYGIGTEVGIRLPYDRTQESEADHIGLILMARAGYDPRGAINFWERMKESGGASPPEFLSTHPAPSTRIDQIKTLMPQALTYYSK